MATHAVSVLVIHVVEAAAARRCGNRPAPASRPAWAGAEDMPPFQGRNWVRPCSGPERLPIAVRSKVLPRLSGPVMYGTQQWCRVGISRADEVDRARVTNTPKPISCSPASRLLSGTVREVIRLPRQLYPVSGAEASDFGRVLVKSVPGAGVSAGGENRKGWRGKAASRVGGRRGRRRPPGRLWNRRLTHDLKRP